MAEVIHPFYESHRGAMEAAIASTLPKRCCASARIYPTLMGLGWR